MHYPEHGARGDVASHRQASEKHTRQEVSGAVHGRRRTATGSDITALIAIEIYTAFPTRFRAYMR
jgi:hypothetical protein